MILSPVVTDYLLLLAIFGGLFTTLPAVAVQLLLLMDKEDEPFGKRQYFNLAKLMFIEGLVFAGIAVCMHAFGDNSMVPHRSSVSELWAMLWVAPIVSVVSCFVVTGAVALFTVLWRVLDVLLKSPVGWWCGLLSHGNSSD